MTDTPSSDAQKNLLWFMIGLAILGTILALVLYYAVDLPAQMALAHAPVGNAAIIKPP